MSSRNCCCQSLAGICAADAMLARSIIAAWNTAKGFVLHRCGYRDAIALGRELGVPGRFPVSIGILSSNLNTVVVAGICCNQRRSAPTHAGLATGAMASVSDFWNVITGLGRVVRAEFDRREPSKLGVCPSLAFGVTEVMPTCDAYHGESWGTQAKLSAGKARDRTERRCIRACCFPRGKWLCLYLSGLRSPRTCRRG